jgi:hypothetical protein
MTPDPVPADVRIAIEDLLTEFAFRIDNGLGASIDELFVEDGTITTPAFVLADRAAIRAQFTRRAHDTSRRSRHYWSNLRIARQGELIRATTNVLTVIKLAGSPPTIMIGSSSDTFAPRGDGWAFKDRSLEVIVEGHLMAAGLDI